MQLDNLTDRPILDLAIIIRSTDGQLWSNLLSNTAPPFESHMEISTGIPEIVCYGYARGGQYFSEMREL